MSGLINNDKNKNKNQYIAKQIREELTEESEIDITSVDIGSLTWMITQYDIARFDNDEYHSIKNIIPKVITNKNDNQAFSLIDIGAIIRQYREWKKYLPNIDIFYAVKCNSDKIILKTLVSLGVGLDVASKGEIDMANNADVSHDKIIYANPCKGIDHIRFARSQGVSLMTFDNENELLKIALYHPDAKLILRILVDDITKSKMHFGCKFGCPINNVKNLLNYAKFLKLNITGVSFHVGSGCLDPISYSNSIRRAREVFDLAKKIGYEFTILDIGGGFPGISYSSNKSTNKSTNDSINDSINNSTNNVMINDTINIDSFDESISFADISNVIQQEIKESFGDMPNLRVIAEPGRFFATSALTHVVSITSKKSIWNGSEYSDNKVDDKLDDKIDNVKVDDKADDKVDNKNAKIFHYYIDSSIYGMFNNQMFDKAQVKFQLLNNYPNDKTYKSVIFGETCDSMDKIAEGIDLPELACGDYLYVENHGAYTNASASRFNGFESPNSVYIFTY